MLETPLHNSMVMTGRVASWRFVKTGSLDPQVEALEDVEVLEVVRGEVLVVEVIMVVAVVSGAAMVAVEATGAATEALQGAVSMTLLLLLPEHLQTLLPILPHLEGSPANSSMSAMYVALRPLNSNLLAYMI